MKTKLTLAITVIALGIAMATPALSLSDSESSDFNVTVDEQLAVDVAPDTMVYGENPGNINGTDARGYDGLEIENIGSENITNIYLTASNPSDNPFGTGRATDYDSGNMIQVNPSGELNELVDSPSDASYAYVDRKEYNESNDLEYILTRSSSDRYGRLRMANESVFWMITNPTSGGTSNGCDGSASDSKLYIGDTPHSGSQTGTVDFQSSSNDNYWDYDVNQTTGGDYGKAENVAVNTYQGYVNYTAFTWCENQAQGENTTHVYFQRWNVERPDTGTINDVVDSTERILNAGTESDELQPGEHFTIFTRVAIPNGVAEGDIGQGQLTVQVNNN